MTDSDYTVIQLVIDRSGSMASIQADAEGSINAYIENQRKEPGRCSLRVTQFDTYIETVTPLTDISKVKPFQLRPRGMTALYDAMGKSIVELGAELEALPEPQRPDHVIVVIVTDGEENSSTEYQDSGVIKEMVEKQRADYSWEFVFLAANQDAVMTAATVGIPTGSAITYAASAAGTQAVMDSMISYTATSRSGQRASFNDADRKKAMRKS